MTFCHHVDKTLLLCWMTVPTRAEVDVHQHDGGVVCVDDEVAHTLITELRTLHVRGPGCCCHSDNKRINTDFQMRHF